MVSNPPRGLGWAVAVAAALPALLGAAPTVYWLDSAELAGAAATLGIAHPPGHPLVALLGKALQLVPFGSIAFRANVLQALCLGGAAAAVYALAAAILARARAGADAPAPTWAPHAAAAAVALLLAWSPGAVLQGERAEVYALHLALVAGAAALLARPRAGPRETAGAALLFGLGLANHHLLALAAAPALALLVPWRRADGARALARHAALAFFAAAAGLATYAYLPLRAARLPALQWGFPDTLAGFVDVVSAHAFQKSVTLADSAAAGGTPLARLAGIAAHCGGQLAWAGAAAGLAGLAFLLAAPSARGARRAGAALALLALGTAAAQALVGFDPDNPDAAGYLLPAVAALAIAAAPALEALRALAAPHLGARRAGALALAAVAPLLAVAQLPGAALASLASTWDARTTALAIESAVPTDGALVLSSFRLVFPMQYFRAVEGWRPDTLFLQRKFYFDGQRALYATHDPRIGFMLGDYARVPGDLQPEILAFIGVRRPVVVEYDLWIDAAKLGPATPVGLALLLGAARPGVAPAPAVGLAPPRATVVAAQEAFWNALGIALGGPADPETTRTLLWIHYELSRWGFASGNPGLGASELARALALAPDDPDLRALAGATAPPPAR